MSSLKLDLINGLRASIEQLVQCAREDENAGAHPAAEAELIRANYKICIYNTDQIIQGIEKALKLK